MSRSDEMRARDRDQLAELVAIALGPAPALGAARAQRHEVEVVLQRHVAAARATSAASPPPARSRSRSASTPVELVVGADEHEAASSPAPSARGAARASARSLAPDVRPPRRRARRHPSPLRDHLELDPAVALARTRWSSADAADRRATGARRASSRRTPASSWSCPRSSLGPASAGSRAPSWRRARRRADRRP